MERLFVRQCSTGPAHASLIPARCHLRPEVTPLRYIFRAAYKRRSRPASPRSRLREAPLARHHRQVIRASPNRLHWHCTRKCQTNKLALRVEYIHCAISLGYVEDISLNPAMTHPDLEDDTKNAVARAVNKSNMISYRRRSVMLTSEFGFKRISLLVTTLPIRSSHPATPSPSASHWIYSLW